VKNIAISQQSLSPSEKSLDKLITTYSSEDYTSAIELASRMVSTYPLHPFAWKVLGSALSKVGRVEESLAAKRRSVELDPHDAEAHSNLGNALKEINRLIQAKESYTTAIQLNPNFFQAHANLGNVFFATGEFEEAAACYKTALRLKPNSTEILCNLGVVFAEIGLLSEAATSFRNTLELNPDFYEAHRNLGALLQQQGHFGEAITHLRRSVNPDQHDAKAYFALGTALYQDGQLGEAAENFQTAIRIAPDFAEAHSNLGLVLRDLGHMRQAEASFRNAIQLKPNCYETYNNLGTTLTSLQRIEEAKQAYLAALQLNPNFAEAYCNLGVLLKKQGSVSDAETSFNKAIQLKPNYAEAYNNLGNLLKDWGRMDDAEAAYKHAVQIKPDFFQAHNNLGNVFYARGEWNAAELRYRAAISLKPDFAQAQSNLANVLLALRQIEQAELTYREAIRLDPALDQAHNNLGNLLLDQGCYREAEDCYLEALRINPESAEVYSNLGNVYKSIRRLDAAEACYRKAINLKPTDSKFYSNLLLTILYSEKSKEQIFLEQQKFGEIFENQYKTTWGGYKNTKDSQRRLKIGYVSGDFFDHSMSFFITPILEAHDRSKFEIFAYYNNNKVDGITEKIKNIVDHWTACSSLSDKQMFDLIRNHKIDILVDLSGHTANNRLSVFARKPAPIQMTWMGYPGSTGLSAIDYRITYDSLDPPRLTEQFHTEKLLRLPDSEICFKPIIEAPCINELPALTKNKFVIACLNNHSKISDSSIFLWVKLLNRIPNSVFILGNASGTEVEKQFIGMLNHQKIDPSRLILQPKLPLKKYWELYHSIDLCVDPFPYNGGTTSLQSLWMGVPVVSLAGDSTHSRAGLAVLHRANLESFVANTEEQYVDLAIFWSNNLKELSEIRHDLRKRISSLSHKAKPSALIIENEYTKAWEKYCADPN
jgi:protein O-GlcNAc transferase